VEYISTRSIGYNHINIVTLHAPLNADTHDLLNRLRIDQMKHDAYIINTGRGSLLGTEAFISAYPGTYFDFPIA
jgi:lactate dehydrogenase-like 2-hydroxyacid dehydrogenase